jgi:uncharacterized protein YndB with AHSA1/START domain
MIMGSESAISDRAVQAATGRSWGQWFRILDAIGGTERSHRELAAHLADRRDVSPWWSQAIAVRYELERGLREEGQRGATFEVSVTRTIDVPVQEVHAAWTTARHWNRWFTSGARLSARPGGRYATAEGDRGVFLHVQPTRIAFTWEHPRHCPGTEVEVTLAAQGPARTQVRLTHRQLDGQAAREEMRSGWTWALDSLRSYLETGAGIPSETWEG